MNKKEALEKIQKELHYDMQKTNQINDIVESTFIIGKKNKEKMIKRFMEELKVSENEANNIYEKVMNIIGSGIKDKIKNPFKDLDK